MSKVYPQIWPPLVGALWCKCVHWYFFSKVKWKKSTKLFSPWINNCVGHYNHIHFVLFLFFIVVTSAIYAWVSVPPAYSVFTDRVSSPSFMKLLLPSFNSFPFTSWYYVDISSASNMTAIWRIPTWSTFINHSLRNDNWNYGRIHGAFLLMAFVLGFWKYARWSVIAQYFYSQRIICSSSNSNVLDQTTLENIKSKGANVGLFIIKSPLFFWHNGWHFRSITMVLGKIWSSFWTWSFWGIGIWGSTWADYFNTIVNLPL
mgnify:CR=1 FL=1